MLIFADLKTSISLKILRNVPHISPCDCIRHPSRSSHCIWGTPLCWQRSSSTSPSHHHISLSTCAADDTAPDRATARRTRSRRRDRICIQPDAHPCIAPSRRSCSRLKDTSATGDCTRRSCWLWAVGTCGGHAAPSGDSSRWHRPPEYHSHERRTRSICTILLPRSLSWDTRSNRTCRTDDRIAVPSCWCTGIWESKCRSPPSSTRGSSRKILKWIFSTRKRFFGERKCSRSSSTRENIEKWIWCLPLTLFLVLCKDWWRELLWKAPPDRHRNSAPSASLYPIESGWGECGSLSLESTQQRKRVSKSDFSLSVRRRFFRWRKEKK